MIKSILIFSGVMIAVLVGISCYFVYNVIGYLEDDGEIDKGKFDLDKE